MADGNGVLADLRNLNREVEKLWATRASNESVINVKDDVERIEKSIDGLRESFSSLMKAILVACVVWALGSAGFLIGVLTLTRGPS